MHARTLAAAVALLAALPLVAAPVTMADWGEQAQFSTEPVDPSELDDEVPVLRYENLSAPAQRAVRSAVESPDGSHVVYGHEDWPERFFYSDYSAPGRGHYGLVYEGEHYRLWTYAGGGFPFVYWVLELPFVLAGLVLGYGAVLARRGDVSARFPGLGAAAAVGLFALGPVFDFPLVAPGQYVWLGVLGLVALAVGLGAGYGGDGGGATGE